MKIAILSPWLGVGRGVLYFLIAWLAHFIREKALSKKGQRFLASPSHVGTVQLSREEPALSFSFFK